MLHGLRVSRGLFYRFYGNREFSGSLFLSLRISHVSFSLFFVSVVVPFRSLWCAGAFGRRSYAFTKGVGEDGGAATPGIDRPQPSFPAEPRRPRSPHHINFPPLSHSRTVHSPGFIPRPLTSTPASTPIREKPAPMRRCIHTLVHLYLSFI